MRAEQISGQEGGFFQVNVWHEGRMVAITANDATGPFSCRLYVGNGELATSQTRRTKRYSGAVRAAHRLLGIAA